MKGTGYRIIIHSIKFSNILWIGEFKFKFLTLHLIQRKTFSLRLQPGNSSIRDRTGYVLNNALSESNIQIFILCHAQVNNQYPEITIGQVSSPQELLLE